MSPKLGLILFIFFSLYVQAISQSNLKAFEGLLGIWEMNEDGFIMQERWTKTTEQTFEGIGLIITDEQEIQTEHIQLQCIGDKVGYIATPKGKNPVLFTLVSSENGKWVFENPEHDSPQRIIYHIYEVRKLKAWTEEEKAGEIIRQEFSFVKKEE